jgi:hypothetical protein
MMRLAGAAGLLVATTIVVAWGTGLDDPLDDGEARIWYLAHAGWLVRTSEHCLVFDYTGPAAGGSLDTGGLSPEVLAGCRTVMFVSHGHPDHFDRRSLELRETVGDLTVVMGSPVPRSWCCTTSSTEFPRASSWCARVGS